MEYKKITDNKEIYDYYSRIKNVVPYWFDVDYSLWLESYNNDSDYDGDKMFGELMTYAAYAENDIVGHGTEKELSEMKLENNIIKHYLRNV